MNLPSFARDVTRTWEENRLFSVLLELTYRCNLDCFFCYNDLGRAGEPLNKSDYARLLEDLAGMQVFQLSLSGGEPLSHPDFFAIGSLARELGFVVRIKSNGHALRGRLAERIRDEIDPFVIEVSLHGASAAVHDRQTRVPGSFERLVGNLREIQRLGLRVKVNSTLTAWNESEIEGMFALTDGLGLPLQLDPEVTLRDDGDATPLSIAASREGLLRIFRIQRRRSEGPSGAGRVEVGRLADSEEPPPGSSKHCGAGSSTLTVDPYGNVYPCVQWRVPVGNLKDSSIVDIWSSSTGLARIRALTPRVKMMLSAYGQDAQALAFCPGSAAARTGDPFHVGPEALERRELARRAQEAPLTLGSP